MTPTAALLIEITETHPAKDWRTALGDYFPDANQIKVNGACQAMKLWVNAETSMSVTFARHAIAESAALLDRAPVTV